MGVGHALELGLLDRCDELPAVVWGRRQIDRQTRQGFCVTAARDASAMPDDDLIEAAACEGFELA